MVADRRRKWRRETACVGAVRGWGSGTTKKRVQVTAAQLCAARNRTRAHRAIGKDRTRPEPAGRKPDQPTRGMQEMVGAVEGRRPALRAAVAPVGQDMIHAHPFMRKHPSRARLAVNLPAGGNSAYDRFWQSDGQPLGQTAQQQTYHRKQPGGQCEIPHNALSLSPVTVLSQFVAVNSASSSAGTSVRSAPVPSILSQAGASATTWPGFCAL